MANKGTTYITYPSSIPVLSDGSFVERVLESRFSDVINVKDFGAAGDGVTDDASAINAAIAYAGDNGGRKVFIPAGTYLVGSPLLMQKSIDLVGSGYGSTTTTASFPVNAATEIVADHQGSILIIKSANESEYLHAGSLSGVLFNGSATASIGVQAQSTRDFFFDFACLACTTGGFLLSNGNNALSANNKIGKYFYDSSSNAACESSYGLLIAEADADNYGQGTTRTCADYLNCTGGKNGNGVIVGDHDAGYFARVDASVKSGGTGEGFTFLGVTGTQPRPSRKNVIGMLNGWVYAKGTSRNAVLMVNSEPSSVIIEDEAVLDYSVIDRNNGSRFETFRYQMSHTLDFGTGDFALSSATLGFTGGGAYPTVSLPDDATSVAASTKPIPREWALGDITGMSMVIYSASAGDVYVRRKVGVRGDGESLGNVAVDDTSVVTLAAGVQVVNLSISAEVLLSDKVVMASVSRLASDTLDTIAGAVHLLGCSLTFTSDGPYSDGGKTWDSPVDVQIDPD